MGCVQLPFCPRADSPFPLALPGSRATYRPLRIRQTVSPPPHHQRRPIAFSLPYSSTINHILLRSEQPGTLGIVYARCPQSYLRRGSQAAGSIRRLLLLLTPPLPPHLDARPLTYEQLSRYPIDQTTVDGPVFAANPSLSCLPFAPPPPSRLRLSCLGILSRRQKAHPFPRRRGIPSSLSINTYIHA